MLKSHNYQEINDDELSGDDYNPFHEVDGRVD